MKNLRHLLRRISPSNTRRGRDDRARQRQTNRRLLSESLENRQLLAGDSGEVLPPAPPAAMAHNQLRPFDVDNNKSVTARDALLVINHINMRADGESITDPSQFEYFVDVNGDNKVTALDALQVINAMNRMGGEDASDQVELFLSARQLNDQLLPNSQNITTISNTQNNTVVVDYQATVGDLIKLEVAALDLRTSGTGVFQVAADIITSQAGILEPVVGEIQEIRLDGGIVGRTGTARFTNSLTGEFNTVPLADFLGTSNSSREQFIANQIVDLYDDVTSASQLDVDFRQENDQFRLATIRFADVDLANRDFPRLLIDVTADSGTPFVATQYNELDVFTSPGQFNPLALAGNFELQTRNITERSVNLYGSERSFGRFNSATGSFDEVGVIGPTSFMPTFFEDVLQLEETEFQAGPTTGVAYDAFSILVRAIAPTGATPLTVSLDPPDEGDGLLIYGTVSGREGVLNEDIALDETSRFRLTVAPASGGGIMASPGSITLNEDPGVATTLNLVPLVNATTTTETITYAITTQPTNGTASVAPNGTLSYTPNPNYFGPDTLTYTASNVTDGSASAGVSITVNPVNDAPVATNDTASATAGVLTTINVLSNDNTGPGATPGTFEPGTLTITDVSDPANGTAAIVSGQINYTADASFAGPTDTFTYTISDGALTATATVTVTVQPAASGIVARNQTVTVAEDAPEGVIVADLNTLVTVTSGGAPTFEVVTQTGGTARVNGNQLLFTPAADVFGDGAASITYRATNTAGSANGVITVNITADNTDITARNDNFDVNEGATRTLDVLANDEDGPNETGTLTITAVSVPDVGTVTRINNNTQLSYTAPANSGPGTASFTYTISDGQGGTATASVSINILNVLGAPVATDGARTIAEDSGLNAFDLAPLVTRDPGDTTVFTLVGAQPTIGTAAISGSTLNFTPAANQSGTATIRYRATSSTSNLFSEADVVYTVTPVNDAPVAANLTRSVARNSQIDIDVVAAATDIESNALTPAIVTNPTNGTASIVNNQIRYIPTPGFSGTDSITYRVNDGAADSANATINITVTATLAVPVANDGTLAAVEDGGARTLNLQTISTGEAITYTIVTPPATTAGTASISGNTLTFTPTADFFGTATLTYRATNTAGNDTGVVTINVSGVNDPPTAGPDTATTFLNQPITVNVLVNDSVGPANENQTPMLSIVTNGTRGVASVQNGQIRYVPANGETGVDIITYRLSDGVDSVTTTLTVTINEFPPVTISSRLFVDSVTNLEAVIASGGQVTARRSGVFEPGETVLGGVPITLRAAAGQGSTFQPRTVFTNLEGIYEFTNVPPGTYEVVYQLPTNAIASGEAADGIVPVVVSTAGVVSPVANFTMLTLGDAGTYNSNIVSPGTGNRTASGEPITGGATVFFDGAGFQAMFQPSRGFDGVQFAELALNNNRDSALLTVVRDGVVSTAVVGTDRLQRIDGSVYALIGGVQDFDFEATIDAIVQAEYPAYRDVIDAVLANN